MRLIDTPMIENDIGATTIGEFLKTLLITLWEEGEGFSGKRPFGNSDWEYQVYASLIKAGYDIGRLDEDGYVEDVDCQKADRLVKDAIKEVFEAEPVKHGRGVYEKPYQGMKHVCSECGEIPECFEPNHYPNCGAKMQGDPDE